MSDFKENKLLNIAAFTLSHLVVISWILSIASIFFGVTMGLDARAMNLVWVGISNLNNASILILGYFFHQKATAAIHKMYQQNQNKLPEELADEEPQ